MRRLIVLFALFFSGCGLEGYLHHTFNSSHPYPQIKESEKAIPADEPVLMSLDQLQSNRTKSLKSGSVNEGIRSRVIERANLALSQTPPSVTDSPVLYENQAAHDYASLAIYWWPDPSAADGKPYIRRDGDINPEVEDYDYPKLTMMVESVRALALAGYFSGDSTYHKAAGKYLNTWFCDPSTRMNPNLNFAQGIPGRTEGRNYGIIDTYHFIYLLDAVYLLRAESQLPNEIHSCMQSWFSDFNHWLLTSEFGIREANTLNNHGTWYDAQLVAFTTFTGQHELAKRILSDITSNRILRHIDADGRQPREMRRADGTHYLIYNLEAYKNLIRYGRFHGINLFLVEDERSGGLIVAIDFVNQEVSLLEPDNPYSLYWLIIRAQMLGESIQVTPRIADLLKEEYLPDVAALSVTLSHKKSSAR